MLTPPIRDGCDYRHFVVDSGNAHAYIPCCRWQQQPDQCSAALWARARAFVRLGSYSDAVGDLSQYLTLKPMSLNAMQLRGHCYALMNDLKVSALRRYTNRAND